MIVKHGDCLELMGEIPDASVDAVITDPPFFQGFNHNGTMSGRGDLSISKPFFRQFFAEIDRVCKPRRAVYIFTDWRTNDFFMAAMSEFMEVKNCLAWIKTLGTGYTYQNAYESILFHCEKGRRITGPNVITGIKSFNGGAVKTNGTRVHPAQKPVELIEKLIADGTRVGDVILDPMMGSGTTGVACKRMKRDFIGFEIDETYFNTAAQRIETAHADPLRNATLFDNTHEMEATP